MSIWVRVLGFALAVSAAAAEPSADAVRRLPPAATRTVDFKRDIQPILEASCVKCHGRGKANGEWKLDTRETFLLNGESGAEVTPGNSATSRLIHLVAATDPDDVMPKKGSRLTPEQIGLLRAWVDQGLPWESGVTFARPPAKNLQPRHPQLPPGPESNPVDRLLKAYAQQHAVSAPSAVEDRVFARRVYLDVVGLLPTPEELNAFLHDRSPEKRTRLVRHLLADNQKYAQNWLSFWNDLLRNDFKGTGYIDGGRKQITTWLYAALRNNLPYDRMVRDLVNPTAANEGFTKGIVWRGAVNASMTPPMQAAQNIGQVLMGVNLKCASCHDSFIDDWQLADSYGLAGIYADKPLEMVLCDKPTGKIAPLRFLFPELGSVTADSPRTNRLEQLARIITRPENGRLPRTLVNRLWARFLGRGLVEPIDVMQNEAWSPDILDWLAEDLVEHQWNIKRTMEMILTSAAYQLPSVSLTDKPDPDSVFRGPAVRRLTAEQFRDALGSLTGIWHDKPEGDLDRLLIEPGNAQTPSADAYWIWSDAQAATGVPPGTNWFRRQIVLNAAPTEGTLFVHADNSARVFVNGKSLNGSVSPEWDQPSVYDLRQVLRAGTNILAFEAINGGEGKNPAGLLAYARIRHSAASQPEEVWDIATDAHWRVSTQHTDKWETTDFTEEWPPVATLGASDMAPWNLGHRLADAVAGRSLYGQVRASLNSADPLSRALGRPNREQVTTVRQSTATTLQALELTNGETLAKLLRQGAEKLLTAKLNGPALAQRLFLQGVSRPPSATELQLASELVGSTPSREGVEDFLWSLAMLPEFQLNY